MTPRITISEDLAKQLEGIKGRSYNLRGRGMEDVIAYVVEEYNRRDLMDTILEKHQREIVETLKGEVSKGVEDALKKWIQNILSFGKP